MIYAEFEFWKIDSAFGNAPISALLPGKFTSDILHKLIEKAKRVAYNTEKLEAAFKNFGWAEFLPLYGRGGELISAQQLYEFCYQKLVEKEGENKVRKIYDFSAENFITAIYFAYKATELLEQEFEKGGVRISAFKQCNIPLQAVLTYLFITRGVPHDRFYTSVLTVLVYAVSSNFEKGLLATQMRIQYYATSGINFGKNLTESWLTLLELTANHAVASRKGILSRYYQLIYTVDEYHKKILLETCGKLGLTYQVRSKHKVSLDSITPFKIMANYFRLKLNFGKNEFKESIAALLRLVREKRRSPDSVPKLKRPSVETLIESAKIPLIRKKRPPPQKVLVRPPSLQQAPKVGEDPKAALKSALLKEIRETPGIPDSEAAELIGTGPEGIPSLLDELSRSNDAEVRRAVRLHRLMGVALTSMPPKLVDFLMGMENGIPLVVLMSELRRTPRISPIELQQKTLFSLDMIASLLKELASLSKNRSRVAEAIRAVFQQRKI